jgi:hypothetical protein
MLTLVESGRTLATGLSSGRTPRDGTNDRYRLRYSAAVLDKLPD